jgi:hypothetical protein
MTAETNKLLNDPNFVIQFAVGEPVPHLIPQDPNVGIVLGRLFFNEPKRYVWKKAHMSLDDNRVFDYKTGHLVYNSSHPGSDPHSAFDPLGLTNQGDRYTQNTLGAEWESICDVRGNGVPSVKVRPKKLSRHGRQFVKAWDSNEILFSVGKVGKLKSMSFRPNFAVFKGTVEDVPTYTLTADMMGRTMEVVNTKGELVAVMTRTNKALIMNAAGLGSGAESTIDIAPGVDCTFILAMIFAVQQVGAHFANDMFNSYVVDGIKGAAVSSVTEATGMQGAVSQYTQMSNQAQYQVGSLARAGRFINANFFQ